VSDVTASRLRYWYSGVSLERSPHLITEVHGLSIGASGRLGGRDLGRQRHRARISTVTDVLLRAEGCGEPTDLVTRPSARNSAAQAAHSPSVAKKLRNTSVPILPSGRRLHLRWRLVAMPAIAASE
jgi:hypothetical protein